MSEMSGNNSLKLEYERMRDSVNVAEEQAVMSTMFHETWRPAATDEQLRARMGVSFATHSFQVVRWALRRELILALMRIWDNNRRALSAHRIGQLLSSDDFFSMLVEDRVSRIGYAGSSVVSLMKDTLGLPRRSALALIAKYQPNGSGHSTYKRLRTLRDKRLAHRELGMTEPGVDPTDDEVEIFYRDTLELVSHLLHVVNGVAFDLTESAGIYAKYAGHFWASARGERTEGHPEYRPSHDEGN